MLFRKVQSKMCIYCKHCSNIDKDLLLCVKRGIVSADKSCSKFIYDPLKRIPPRKLAVDRAKFNEDDFNL